MPAASLANLIAVMAIAFGAPFLLGFFPRIRVPTSVLEIVAGVVVGPAALGWVHVDETLRVLSTLGLAFLMFLSGLQVDLTRVRGRIGNTVLAAFGVSFALGVGVAAALHAGGLVESTLFAAILLASTAPGIVIPFIRDAGFAATQFGRIVVAASGVSATATAVLLSVFYSRRDVGAGTRAVLLGAFALLIVAIAIALGRAERSTRIGAIFTRLQDTSAQIRVRAAVLLLVGIVVLAQRLGVEVVLSAFVAGAIVRVVDADAKQTHPKFFVKLEAIGFGFVVPIFFVVTGLRFDASALFASGSAAARVPALLAALFVVRALPALMYRKELGVRRSFAAGLMQAMSITFLVAGAQIGTEIGTISRTAGAALVAAGLLSVVVFPPLALGLLRGGVTESPVPETGPA